MKINLPDGSSKELQDGSNGLDLAKSIGAGLAKSAVAVSIDGKQRDLLDELPDNSSVSIITIQSDEGLEIPVASKQEENLLSTEVNEKIHHSLQFLPEEQAELLKLSYFVFVL